MASIFGINLDIATPIVAIEGKVTDHNTLVTVLDCIDEWKKDGNLEMVAHGYRMIGKYFYPLSLCDYEFFAQRARLIEAGK